MQIEISYEYKMKNSFQLHKPEVRSGIYRSRKNASVVDKKFDRLCLFEFWELHSEARSPDPKKLLNLCSAGGH